MNNTNNKTGRKHKIDKQFYVIHVRLSEAEYVQLQNMMDKFGQQNRSKVIRDRIFGREIKVVTTDNSLYKVVEWLTKIHSQYRAIGVNYNQTVKQINSCFNANQAAHLLGKLENYTINLVRLSEQITMVIGKLKEKYGGKN